MQLLRLAPVGPGWDGLRSRTVRDLLLRRQPGPCLPYGPPVTESWDPGTYHRFRSSRSAPFHDLVALLAPVAGGRAV